MNRAEYGRIIAKNLKRIAYEHDKSQTEIAKDLGLKRVTVSSWMNGTRIPRIEKIDKLCQYFHVTRADITEEYSEPSDTEEPIKVKVYGRVAAGVPMSMIEDITGEEEIPADWGRGGKEYFALTIRGTKTQNSDRVVPIPPVMLERLSEARRGLVCHTLNGTHHNESSYKRMVSSLERAMNIDMGGKLYRNELLYPLPLAKDFVPYLLRHTYCTDLKKKGVDVRTAKELMGHADIRTTANIYDHCDNESLMEAARLIST